jgi:hypothetical protein
MNRAALTGLLVQPETALGWHRESVRRRWQPLVDAEARVDQVSIPRSSS